MKQYIDIAQSVLNHGQWKENRTGIKTLTTFCEIFRHNMSDGYPLLTTKRVAFKTMAVELEGFIKAVTAKQWYQERGCKIWNEWANPETIQRKIDKGLYNLSDAHNGFKELQKQENDLGPIYGYQWRGFNGTYYDPNGS